MAEKKRGNNKCLKKKKQLQKNKIQQSLEVKKDDTAKKEDIKMPKLQNYLNPYCREKKLRPTWKLKSKTFDLIIQQ